MHTTGTCVTACERKQDMKRNRADIAPNSGVPAGATPPAKFKRREKKPPGLTLRKAAAASREKPHEARGEDQSLCLARVAVAAVESSPLLAAAALEAAGDEGWQGATELVGGLGWWWWWWGVEEEKLLGWFPFADKDFLSFEDGGGSSQDSGGQGILWEEDDHDIWQLQQIREIPSTANQ